MDIMILIAFILYFVFVLAMGTYFYRRTKNMEDYVLGGREMNPYVTALSAQASDMSGWLLMGLPGAIFLYGIGEVWIGIGLAIGSYLAWLIIAKRLRNYSEKCGNALTVSQYFSNRFKDNKGALKVICGLVILVFFTFYVTSGFVAGGNLFVVIFGGEIDYTVAVLVTAAVIIGYTFLGGFKAVSWTDLVQGMLMLLAVVIIPLTMLGVIDGGWNHIVDVANFYVDDFTNIMYDAGKPIGIIALVSLFGWGLGYFGMPHILVRYMAIRDPEEVKVARRVGTAWVIVALTAVSIIAMMAWAFIDQGEMPLPTNSENVIINIIGSGLFPSIIAGVLFAAIMAAIMSTADSQLLVASSAVANDLFDKFAKKKPTEQQLMWISRIAVVIIAIIALVLSLGENKSIMKLVSFAWAGFGAAFGATMIMSLFWKRINRQGAIAGIVVGALTAIFWNIFMIQGGALSVAFSLDCCIVDTGLYELIPGFIFSLIAIVVVSLLTPEPSDEMKQEFDEATAGKFF